MAVLEQGQMVGYGQPSELLTRPRSAFAATLGGVNWFEGELGAAVGDGVRQVHIGQATLLAPAPAERTGRVAVAIAPGDVELGPWTGEPLASNAFRGEVSEVRADGAMVRVRLSGELPLTALVTPAAAAELGVVPGVRILALFKVAVVRVC